MAHSSLCLRLNNRTCLFKFFEGLPPVLGIVVRANQSEGPTRAHVPTLGSAAYEVVS